MSLIRILDMLLRFTASCQLLLMVAELFYPGASAAAVGVSNIFAALEFIRHWLPYAGAEGGSFEGAHHSHGRPGFLLFMAALMAMAILLLWARLLVFRRLFSSRIAMRHYRQARGARSPISGLIELDSLLFGGYFILGSGLCRWPFAGNAAGTQQVTVAQAVAGITSHPRFPLVASISLLGAFGSVALWGEGDPTRAKYVLLHGAYSLLLTHTAVWLPFLAVSAINLRNRRNIHGHD